MVKPQRTKVIDALHRSRMRPYLDATQQNEKRALALYRWHSELTAACQPVLGATEVILRNAMDRRLQDWNNEETGGTHSWLLSDPVAPLRSLSAGKRKEANERARKAFKNRPTSHRRYGQAITHDDVLAQVTFGLWKELLPNHQPGAGNTTENNNRMRLWREALEPTFPNVNDPDGETTFWRVAHVHSLRNRVSHMESILDIDVLDIIQDSFDLLKSIDQGVANWITGASKVKTVFRDKPKV